MQEHCNRSNLMNLAVAGRKLRRWAGVIGMVATLGAAAWMVTTGVDPLWRWSLLGAWQMGCGTQRVPDRGLESTLRTRAWKLIGAALCLALALTSLACLCCTRESVARPGPTAEAGGG